MQIRQIQVNDISPCLEIYNYYIKNSVATFEENTLSLQQFNERVDKIVKRFPFLVAVENAKIVGYTYLDFFNERSAYRYTADLSIYVHKDFLHSGVGKSLYNEIEKIARQNGIKNIISIVTKQNASSMRFHEKSGFVNMGALENVGLKFNQWLSVVYYQKSLVK